MKISSVVSSCIICMCLIDAINATLLSSLFGQNAVGIPGTFDNDLGRRRCPLCDSSVYSYCSDKLFHDSCCCHNPNNPYDHRPHECQYADCSFLHANTCREHKLITACCCINHVIY